jgi:uncharacterized membrane protein (DUF106 family)
MKIPILSSERHTESNSESKDLVSASFKPKAPISMVVIFAFGFLIAFLLKLASEHWIPDGVFRILTDHISIAIIGASILGITYDFVLEYKREEAIANIIEQFQDKFRSHEETILEYLKMYALYTPKEVFDLLQDIASQTSATPTLYRIARVEQKEYTFSKSILTV